MKDSLREASDAVKADLFSLKRRFNSLKADLDSTQEAIDKMELKISRFDTEIENYKLRIKKEFSKENDKLEKENDRLIDLLQTYVKAMGGRDDSDEDEQDDEEIEKRERVLKATSTVSILEEYLKLIEGGHSSFTRISHAIIFPNVYDQLLDDYQHIRDEYVLEKTIEPSAFMSLVKSGRKYVEELFDEIGTHLTGNAWEENVGEIDKWWKNEVLPYLYLDKPDVPDRFCKEPLTQDQMELLESKNDKKLEKFPKISDVLEWHRENWKEVSEYNGLKEIKELGKTLCKD